VPSVSPSIGRLPALAACVCLLAAGTAGCSTTQEKAEIQKAKAEHILNARAGREKAKKRHKSAHKHQQGHVGGPKTGHIGRKSAHQHSGGNER
jgi:hypothetical protein